jgi:hypothetical protein
MMESAGRAGRKASHPFVGFGFAAGHRGAVAVLREAVEDEVPLCGSMWRGQWSGRTPDALRGTRVPTEWVPRSAFTGSAESGQPVAVAAAEHEARAVGQYQLDIAV